MVELNIRSKAVMKIHAYFFCKNEELILPYLLKHYGEFCEKITFFDNESTDRSREIIEAFTECETEIITNSTEGVLRDDIHLHLKNNCWKGVDADYVIVADADEFLYNENLVEFLTENPHDVYYPTGYNMISAHFPEDYEKPLIDQVTLGSFEPNYSKSVIFNPKTVQEINFTPGAHFSHPTGVNGKPLQIYRGTVLKLLHYKNLGFEYRYEKNSRYGAMLSEENKRYGYGFHYNFSQEEQYREYATLYVNKSTVLQKPLPKVSFTITTCNRLDLLERTLNSFFDICKFPFHEYIMTDDSGDDQVYSQLCEKWGDRFTILQNKPKIGLSKSIDRLFQSSTGEYIFHCEDDWLFESNPNMVENSLSILQEYPFIHQVYVRHVVDNPQKPEEDMYYTLDFIAFNTIPWWRGEWSGFTWNPGLRRKSDYLRMFPDGFNAFGDEIDCSKHTMQFEYKAVVLQDTSCRHIGYGRHTANFII